MLQLQSKSTYLVPSRSNATLAGSEHKEVIASAERLFLQVISPSPSRHRRRAPRASLHGTVSANIQLPNRRKIPSKLQLLSITGGLLEVSSFVDERTKVVLAIPFASGTAYPKAEMLF